MCIFLRVFDIQNIYIDIYLYKRHSKCPRANIKLKVRKPHVHTQTTSIHHLAFHQFGEAFSRFVLSPRRRCIPSSEDGQIWPVKHPKQKPCYIQQDNCNKYMRAFKAELSLQHLRTPHLDTRRLLLSKVVNSLLCHCFHIFIEGQSRVQNFHHLQQLGKIPALRMPRRVSLYRWGCTSLTLCPSILEKCLFACMCVCMHTNERQGLQLEKS